ncbi:MAG TPA: hypothetical protein VFS19_03000 [Planctomycetota bacterium]|nr:hypothetical protein [Planctomycetota bacterium]
MRKALPLLLLAALASCEKSNAANDVAGSGKGKTAAAEEIHDIEMIEFGNFDFIERAPLPDRVKKWNGKLVRATGFMNPGRQVRDVKEFELVMNRDSCCYGTRPRMNHFFQVILEGAPTVYTSDPIKVVGRFVIDEQWDGDWQLGLYWLKEAKVEK